jgi:nucleoside-triphosphatase THEP1
LNTDTLLHVAAVVYEPDEHDRQALANFARELAAQGYRIGGMVQEAFFDAQGRRERIDSVDLASGERVTINQPSRKRDDGSGCTLDTAALADSGAPLRRALNDKPDLVVVEKFGEQEQEGAGLMDEIFAVMAAGIPTLVLVPEAALESWRVVAGDEMQEVPCAADQLSQWWQQRRSAD